MRLYLDLWWHLFCRKLFLFGLLVLIASPGIAADRCVPSQRLFPFRSGNTWGFIDQTGQTAIPPKYGLVEPFSDGFAQVYIDGKHAFVDDSGLVKFRAEATKVEGFSEGLAAFRSGRKWGFLDSQGYVVIDPLYESVLSFSEGVAAVRDNSEWKYIDHQGKVNLQVRAREWDHKSFNSFHEGRAPLESLDGHYGYIGRDGEWAIPPIFQDARRFSEGLAAVKIGGLWGYIDRNGTIVIEATLRLASAFSEGLAAVTVVDKPEGENYGFLRPDGSFAIPPRFGFAKPFCNGMAVVSVGKLFGYINSKGDLVVVPQFKEAFSFTGNLAPVITADEHDAYIKKDGRIAWISGEVLPNVEY